MPGEWDDGSLAFDPAISRICGIVGAGNKVYSCARELDLEVLTGRAALAAPIRSGDGELLGVLLVGAADPACLIRAGEVAITLGNFILGARHLEHELPALENAAASRRLRQPQNSMPRIAGANVVNAQVRR